MVRAGVPRQIFRISLYFVARKLFDIAECLIRAVEGFRRHGCNATIVTAKSR